MMTSLFRRGGGHHGDADNGGTEAPAEFDGGRRVKRLEFGQAMDDFQTMFPGMEQEVIECVLRANHGAVDATIDQLLLMSLDGHDSDDSSDSDDSIPPEVLERTLEPDSSDEEPPPIYSPPSYDMHIYDRKHPDDVMPAPPARFDAAQPPPSQRPVGSYRNWNPPLLGNLPDDFLRILPQQLDSLPRSHSGLTLPSSTSSSSSLSSLSSAAAAPGPVAMETEQGTRLKQYLEDERIALFLQNEEFMRELQRNRDFIIALERALHAGLPGYAVLDGPRHESATPRPGHSPAVMRRSTAGDNCASGSGGACTTISDDALFRDKLKHMGKSTRKKLFELARVFSEKTRRRKTKRRTLLKHQSAGNAASTANLLDDEEGLLSGEDRKLKRPGTQEEEVPQQEVLSW